MIAVSGKISGLESVVADIQGMPQAVLERVMGVVSRYAELVLNAQRANLSGGVLEQRSHRLYDQLRVQLMRDARHVYALIGTSDYVGRFWERGFNGQQHVRGHLRALKSGTRLQLVKMSRSGRLRKGRLYAAGATSVKPYDRLVDGRPRPWASPALEPVRDQFRDEVRRAMEGVVFDGA